MENVAQTSDTDIGTTTDQHVPQLQPENTSRNDMDAEATSDEWSRSRNRNLDILKAYIQRQRALLERIKQDVDCLEAARPTPTPTPTPTSTPTTDLPSVLGHLLLHNNNTVNDNSGGGSAHEDGDRKVDAHSEVGVGRLSELVDEILGDEDTSIVKEVNWEVFRGHDTSLLHSLPSRPRARTLTSTSFPSSVPHSPMHPLASAPSTPRSSPLSAFAFPVPAPGNLKGKEEPSALVTRVREMRARTVDPALARAAEYMAELALPPNHEPGRDKDKSAGKANGKREGARSANGRKPTNRRKSEAAVAAAATRPRGYGGRFRRKEGSGVGGGDAREGSGEGSGSTSVSGEVRKGKAFGQWTPSASMSASASVSPAPAPRGRLTIRIPVRRALKGKGKSVAVEPGDGERLASPLTGVTSAAGGSWSGKRCGSELRGESVESEGGEEGEENCDGEDGKSATTMRSGSTSLVRFVSVNQEEDGASAMDVDLDERDSRFRNETRRGELDSSHKVKKESMFYPEAEVMDVDADRGDPFSDSDDSFVCEALPPSPGPSSSTSIAIHRNGNGKPTTKTSIPPAESRSPGTRRGDKDSKTFNVTWSDEEQRVLDMLLERYPDGTRNRWANISRAMGGERTPRQVASRVQKYFAKMKKWGIEVP